MRYLARANSRPFAPGWLEERLEVVCVPGTFTRSSRHSLRTRSLSRGGTGRVAPTQTAARIAADDAQESRADSAVGGSPLRGTLAVHDSCHIQCKMTRTARWGFRCCTAEDSLSELRLSLGMPDHSTPALRPAARRCPCCNIGTKVANA